MTGYRGALAKLWHVPAGEVRVRWLGPLSEVHERERRFQHLMARAKDLAGKEGHVIATRMVVEVETHWNFLRPVSAFRDWAINLAHHLERHMHYEAWRQDYLERTVDDLDWKLGYVKPEDRDTEPGLIERLKRMDERLAALEQHLWPDELPSGEGDGAWLQAPRDERP